MDLQSQTNATRNQATLSDTVCPDVGDWLAGILLAAICSMFILVRIPVAYLQPGGQDEDQYSVPGLTVLATGIPRLPNLPARNPESVFYRADEALFAQMPLYFYWQAAFYAALPDQYGTARLSSAIAGLVAIASVFWIARQLTGRNEAGLMAAGLLSWSRWFYFAATTSRPDQLCVAWSLLAVACFLQSRNLERRDRWLCLSGFCLGFSGLTHLFAISTAIPLGLWSAADEVGGARRIRSFSFISGCALVTVALWIPLILAYPEAFRGQFHNQFVSGTGDSLWGRILSPAAALRYQWSGMLNHIGWPQMILPSGAVLICALFSMRRRQALWIGVILTGIGSALGVVLMLGDHHLGFGYWGVPAALAYVAAASLPIRASNFAGLPNWSRRWVAMSLFGAMCLAHVPGCGLRTLVVYWQHRHDVRYNAPRFAQELMRSIPPDARCSVDAQFLLDFYVSGRPTLNLQSMPKYFLTQQHPYDYMIVSRFGVAERTAELADGELLQTLGIRDDPFACYAEIYRPRSHPQAIDPTDQ